MRLRTLLAGLLLAASAAWPQAASRTKTGPPDPPKPDVPFIIHADTLLETEIGEAKEETRKDEQWYTIPGASASIRTPLAGPEFLFLSESIRPDKLQLFKLDSKGGRREVLVMRKKKPVVRPVVLSVFRVHDKVYRIRVDDSLTAGEYSLSPDGSNAVFCFGVD